MKRIDVRDLELRHSALDFAIHELDRRGSHMTPVERERVVELKKVRLATKDQLYRSAVADARAGVFPVAYSSSFFAGLGLPFLGGSGSAWDSPSPPAGSSSVPLFLATALFDSASMPPA